MINLKENLRTVVDISFKDIYPIWKDCLWPGRKSPIQRTSAMKYRGGYNMDYLNRTPYFFGIRRTGKKLIGVLSCFPTEEGEFRMRGLWVHPQFRGQGLSKILVKKVVHYTRLSGAKRLWSLPRVSYKPLYLKYGFSDFFGPTNEFEFGPHFYAMMDISDS